MILPLEQLKFHDFTLKNINIFHQAPAYRILHHRPNGRRANGFLYILHGHCRYVFEEGSFDLVPGSVTYLPSGSKHTFEVLSERIEFYRIDFDRLVKGEITRFSTHPIKLCHTADHACSEAVQKLADGYEFLHDSVAKTALLCTIFHSLEKETASKSAAKLSPAVRYLLEHLTEKVSCSHLASLCYLSTAQFYNLFHEEFGCAPLEYRNTLILQKAESFLRSGSFSVTEISEMLGFESVSYFSRFFKKHSGINPSRFQKEKM